MWIVGYRWDTQGQLGDGSLAPLQGVAANTNQSESDNQLSALAVLSYLLASGAGGVRKVGLCSAGVLAYQNLGLVSACLLAKTLVWCLLACLPVYQNPSLASACLPACLLACLLVYQNQNPGLAPA